MSYNAMEKRFKNNYEMRSRQYLYRRMPVIIRLDGKAFHTFTKGFQKPFDNVLITTMQEVTKYLCENIQGCVLGYTQSDEISLLLVDYNDIDTCAWFDYRLDKLVSVSASMATLAFNKYFSKNVHDFITKNGYPHASSIKYIDLIETYQNAVEKGALFDARAFNLPMSEVTNYFFSRQNDATRNSIQMVGQYYFSQKELHKKNTNDIQDMLLTQKDVNWNNFTVPEKRGTCVIKSNDYNWIIDTNIPIFKDMGRSYIEPLFNFL